MDGTRRAVIDAVEEVCGTDPVHLVDHATLEDLEIDSLDLLEVGMVVEERLGVVVEAEQFEGVETFGETLAVFERLVADRADA